MREVILVQADEQYKPPDSHVLNVSVVADVAFLAICKYEDDNKGIRMERVATVSVGVQELLLALHSSVHAQAATDARKKREAARGNPPS